MLKLEKNYLSELKIAEEFLDASKRNLESSIRTSANRLYFAFEKAVISYLYFKNTKIPKNHQKLWEISAEYLGEEHYSLLRELYDLRMQADYGAVSVFVNLIEKVLKENFIRVEFFIDKIREKIGKWKKR